MTKRRTVLKGSSALLLALATGCASSPSSSNPATNVTAAGGAGLISNNASGLISNNAGGLISNNAGGLISNNAGGLISNNAGGLISNNAGGLISNNAGGLISNNAGGLTGTVRGPAAGLISNNAGGLISNNAGGLVSNNAGGLISNNAGGLISNNAGGLISNNAGGFRVLEDVDSSSGSGDDLTEPVKGAKVAVFNERGEQISYAWTTTDDGGNYTFDRLKPSGPLLFVKAVYMREGKQCVLISTAPAPRKPGLLKIAVTPASSITAKKLGEMIRRRAVSAGSIRPASVDKLTAELAPVMTPKAVVAAAILEPADVANTFDNMLKESPALSKEVVSTGSSEGIATVVASTPADVTGAAPAVAPAAPPPIAAAPAGDNSPAAPAPADAGPSGPDLSGHSGDAAAPSGTSGGTVVSAPQGGTSSGSQPAGNTSSGGGTSAPAAPASTITATIFTLGTAQTRGRVDMASGTNIFGLGDNIAVVAGTLNSTNAAVTFNEDSSQAARAVAYDGTTPYYIVGNQVIGGGHTVTMPDLGPADATDLAVKNGVAYVSSAAQNSIYKVDLAAGTETLWCGTPGATGIWLDGPGATARFNQPGGLCWVGSTLYVADTGNHRIRAVATDGSVSTFAGQVVAETDGVADQAGFLAPTDVTADDQGNLYVADEFADTIRKITPDAHVTTIAGNLKAATKDGTGSAASLNYPSSLGWGKVGGTPVLIVSQQGDKNIRLVTGW